jgi:glycosyltransferase involved in cell wall biosynthesis
VTQEAAAASSRVPVRIFLPADPGEMRIGGIATFVRGFAKYAPADFDVSMVGISASLPPWRWAAVELEGRAIQFLPVLTRRSAGRSRIPLAARFVGALARHGRELGAGVVSSFHRPLTDLPIRRAGPMWRVVHLGVDDLTTSGSESRWARISGPLALSEARSFRRMDRIFVVNEEITANYRARFSDVADRFQFLPNWVDPAIFFPASAEDIRAWREKLATAHGFSPSAPLLLYAGRLDGQKDPILLVRSFAALRRRRHDIHLLVAGEGGLEDRLRSELGALGIGAAVTLLGTLPRESVARLMNAADALLITSAFETGPTVGLEALACGLPVVTTDVGEVAGIVNRSGAGRVVIARDPEAVAEAIASLLGSTPGALRTASVHAAEPFLAQRVLAQVYDANRSLAARLIG